MSAVWVLTYHSISSGPPPLCVDAARLGAQLDFLRAAGFEPVPLRAWATRGGRHFAVTFDDGYADFAECALPVLRARGVPATLFAVASEERGRIAGGIAGARLLEADELRRVAAEPGIEVAGHGVDHVDLTTLADDALARELAQGAERLADWTGRRVEHFAYPFGAFDARVRAAAERAYRASFTTQLAAVPAAADPHAVPRIDAYYLDDPGLRRAVRAGRSDGWLARRRFLRRLRGSEPRRPVPTSAERSPAGALARDQRYASWQ
ncbi:MAG: polysaccharide deacetylase family protein [Myxococcota bacterium]